MPQQPCSRSADRGLALCCSVADQLELAYEAISGGRGAVKQLRFGSSPQQSAAGLQSTVVDLVRSQLAVTSAPKAANASGVDYGAALQQLSLSVFEGHGNGSLRMTHVSVCLCVCSCGRYCTLLRGVVRHMGQSDAPMASTLLHLMAGLLQLFDSLLRSKTVAPPRLGRMRLNSTASLASDGDSVARCVLLLIAHSSAAATTWVTRHTHCPPRDVTCAQFRESILQRLPCIASAREPAHRTDGCSVCKVTPRVELSLRSHTLHQLTMDEHMPCVSHALGLLAEAAPGGSLAVEVAVRLRNLWKQRARRSVSRKPSRRCGRRCRCWN